MEQLNSRAALLDAVRGLREELERVVAEAGEARMEQPGSFGEWTFKDLIAHLTGWRQTTAARLEAGLRGEEPVFPWPARLDEEADLHEINRWFFEANHSRRSWASRARRSSASSVPSPRCRRLTCSSRAASPGWEGPRSDRRSCAAR